MEELSTTLRKYKAAYQSRVSYYLEDYEDNTETQFLKNDLRQYTAYYNALKHIAHFRKVSPRNNLGHFPITSEAGWMLKNINEKLYGEIFTIFGASEEDEFESLLFPGNRAPSISINYDRLRNSITSAKRIIEFINKRLSHDNLAENTNEHEHINPKPVENPYPHIFKNVESFQFFQHLHDKFKSTKNQLADFSFIYRKMYKDGYIIDSFKQQMFMNWVNDKPYEIPLPKVKTLAECSTPDKIRIYDLVKESIQIK